ncbi:MAG: PEP-CTERM sorting domain-containing protein [Planctomycetaceae bacterium]
MVMDRSVLSSNFENSPTQIVSSYLNPAPHTHLMYNRTGFPEDPWLSALDHADAIGSGNILYGEDSFGGAHALNVLPVYNGANVFIRNSAIAAVPEPSSLAALGMGTLGLIMHCRQKRKQAK